MSLLGIGTMQEATGSTAAGSAAASPSDGSPAPSSPAAAEAAGAEPPAAEPPAAPAAGEPAACAAAAAQSPPDGAGQEDGVGTSMLDFVLSQAGKAGPVAAARAAPAGPAAGAAVTNGGCWHATEDPEESIKAGWGGVGGWVGRWGMGGVCVCLRMVGVGVVWGLSRAGHVMVFACEGRSVRSSSEQASASGPLSFAQDHSCSSTMLYSAVPCAARAPCARAQQAHSRPRALKRAKACAHTLPTEPLLPATCPLWPNVPWPCFPWQAVAAMLGEKPGWRATGEVVAVVQPSRRRESVIGETFRI